MNEMRACSVEEWECCASAFVAFVASCWTLWGVGCGLLSHCPVLGAQASSGAAASFEFAVSYRIPIVN